MAQAVLSKGALGGPLTIHIGFTLGVMMAVFVAGGVSGKLTTAAHHVQPSEVRPSSRELGERYQATVQIQQGSEVIGQGSGFGCSLDCDLRGF